jgi:hypothetical protein
MVVFGGFAGAGGFEDLWSLSLGSTLAWSRLIPVGPGPTARHGCSGVFDPQGDRILLFGGRDAQDLCSDLWALSLKGAPAWTKLAPAGAPPSPRMFHGAVFDPVRRRMLIIGGEPHQPNGVWALSLTHTPTWTQLSPVGAPPSSPNCHCSVYDASRDRIVVIGGFDGLHPDRTEVWALTLAGTPAWSEISTSGGTPDGRGAESAIYDPVSDRIVTFGGWRSREESDETWVLTLAGVPTWSKLAVTGQRPLGRVYHTAIFDPARNQMVVFGGLAGRSYRGDAWKLSLKGAPAWAPLGSTSEPGARNGQTMIYDSRRGRILMFGGSSQLSGGLNTVWELALTGTPAWAEMAPSGVAPEGRTNCSAIYDSVRDRMIVFGGWNPSTRKWRNDVWALSLAGAPAWTMLTPMGTPPVPETGPCTIYDPVRDRMLVYGDAGRLVWSLPLSGAPAWTLLSCAGKPPTSFAGCSAIYDPDSDRMLVFGGYREPGGRINPDPEVWALWLSGDPAWSMLNPEGDPPSGRVDHSAVFDARRRGMLVFGGRDDSGYCNDTWLLSLPGNPTWRRIDPMGAPPSGRCQQSAIYDARRERVIVFGGLHGSNGIRGPDGTEIHSSGISRCDDVWALQ